MQDKRYDGYKSFQFLEAGVDYKEFELAPVLNRVASNKVAVTPEQEERVKRLFSEKLMISLHDHCFIAPKDLSQFFEFRRWGRDFTGYEGLAISGLDAVFDNLMNGTAMIHSRGGWKWDDVITDLGLRLSDIAHQDMVVLCTTTEQIVQAKAEGRIAFIVSRSPRARR